MLVQTLHPGWAAPATTEARRGATGLDTPVQACLIGMLKCDQLAKRPVAPCDGSKEHSCGDPPKIIPAQPGATQQTQPSSRGNR
jgi:hypothetical protein